mmetsp:Transcript_53377/g.134032  ORF Transcript_53377/g.134032 Transcript_53377/m.134032 type:complete len:211 (-) Transcript_53377:498-1130(-)
MGVGGVVPNTGDCPPTNPKACAGDAKVCEGDAKAADAQNIGTGDEAGRGESHSGGVWMAATSSANRRCSAATLMHSSSMLLLACPRAAGCVRLDEEVGFPPSPTKSMSATIHMPSASAQGVTSALCRPSRLCTRPATRAISVQISPSSAACSRRWRTRSASSSPVSSFVATSAKSSPTTYMWCATRPSEKWNDFWFNPDAFRDWQACWSD